MAINAGASPDIIVDKVLGCSDLEIGWDFKQEDLSNLLESGVIDPAKVTKTALKNAVSVASTLVTTQGSIVEE